MSKGLWVCILQLALRQKSLAGKLAYFVKGLVFWPFLWAEEAKEKKADNDATNQSSSGDDVYPLF